MQNGLQQPGVAQVPNPGAVFSQMYGGPNNGPTPTQLGNVWESMKFSATDHWYRFTDYIPFLKIILWGVIIVLSVTAFRLLMKLSAARALEDVALGIKNPIITGDDVEPGEINTNWKQVLEHIDSPHESDWRRAILEADIMLDSMLKTLGYVGETLGDRLKAADGAGFNTLSSAWEAHKVRNQIAHEGNNFSINQSEAKRIIKLYEAVFKEFHFI